MPSKKAKANRPAGKAEGPRVLDDENSLKVGPRGPSLHRDWGREAKVQNVPA